MSSKRVMVRVPATSANLGPGFDCLALALDLWNSAEISIAEAGVSVEVSGEGLDSLPVDQENLIVQSIYHFYKTRQIMPPTGLRLACSNGIPVNSGLGSSAAATLVGLVGANTLTGSQASMTDILKMATDIEGHPDNAAAALFGGLVVVLKQAELPLVHRYEPFPLKIALVLPKIHLPTHVARAALPKKVSMEDAVFNLGRIVLVVDALRTGNMGLLQKVMADRLHEPYRLPLLSGAVEAIDAAYKAGAKAVMISGAGPGLLVISDSDLYPALQAMLAVFAEARIPARSFRLPVSGKGAAATILE